MQTRSKRRRVSTLWSRLSAGLVIHVCTFLALPDMAGAGIVDKATERVWRESSLLVEIVLARDTIGVTNAVFRAYIQSMPRQWYVGGLQKCLRPVWNWTRPERFLIWACSSGNLAAIRMCFEASPVLRTSQRRAEDNRYAVRLACRGRDRLPIAKYLFEVQRFDKSDLVANTSILYDACRCSSVDVVRYLVGVGEMTGRDALGNKGCNLRVACEGGDLDVVKLLLELPGSREHGYYRDLLLSALNYAREKQDHALEAYVWSLIPPEEQECITHRYTALRNWPT